MIDSRDALLAVFAELSGKFTHVDEMVHKLEDSREKCMRAIETASSANPLKKSRLSSKKNLPLHTIVTDMLDTFRGETDRWRKEVASFEKCTSFRKCHGDSLLVYVYGKVKSGKSSLGNFLAYGFHNPTQEHVAQHPNITPFFQDDSGQYNAQADEVNNSRCLKVDFLEATSAIQGYTFPGLTWVDSPGIHSLTKENGALAQEYLKSADLVLYTTSAKSALRTSDLDELKSILDAGKNFFLLATKCSEMEEDEDENGNIFQRCVMFSPKDQQEVCHWCVEQLRVEGGKHGFEAADLSRRIFPISTLYAELHPDAQGWEASGMAKLALCLATAAQQDGIRIKNQAPLQSLRAYNEKILGSVDTLKEKMSRVSDATEQMRNEMVEVKEKQLNRRVSALMQEIEQLAQYNTGMDKEFRKKVIQIGQKHVDEARTVILEAFMGLAASLVCQDSTSFDSVKFESFKDFYQKISYPTSKYKRIGTLAGTAAGVLAGLLAGGPLGVFLGSLLGGGAGGAAGDYFDDDSSEQVKIGNNSADVRRAASKQLETVLERELMKVIAILEKDCLKPIRDWYESVNYALLYLEEQLKSQQEDIQKELAI